MGSIGIYYSYIGIYFLFNRYIYIIYEHFKTR